MVRTSVSYNTQDVWEAAAVAWRLNKQRYFKHAEFNYDRVGNNGEYDPPKLKNLPNAMIAREILEGTSPEREDFPYGDRDAAYLITDEDRKLAEEIRGYWASQMIKILSETANGYEKAAIQAATVDQIIHSKDVAVIASSFIGYIRNKSRESINERKLVADSKHLEGNIGDQITIEVEVLSTRYNDNVGKYAVDGITTRTNDLVSWWGKDYHDGEVVMIKGKIRNFSEDWVTKVPSTQLNYVKEIK